METTQALPVANSGAAAAEFVYLVQVLLGKVYWVKLVFAVSILVSNGLLFLLVHKTPQLSDLSTRIVVSLSVADFFYGLISLVESVLVLTRQIGVVRIPGTLSARVSLAMTFGQEWTVYVSLMHTLLIGIDRCVAVMLPLRYPALVTEPRLKATLICTWFTPVAFVLPFLVIDSSLSFKIRTFVKMSMYFAIACCMLAIYGKIGIAALKQRRRIQAAEQNGPTERVSRLTLVLGAVLGCYLLLWLPPIITSFAYIYFFQVGVRASVYWRLAIYWTPLFGMLNSVANVCIYSLMYSKYRRAIVAMCCGRDRDLGGPPGPNHP